MALSQSPQTTQGNSSEISIVQMGPIAPEEFGLSNVGQDASLQAYPMSLPEAPSGELPEAPAAWRGLRSVHRFRRTARNHDEHRMTDSQDIDGPSSLPQTRAANFRLMGSGEFNQPETHESHMSALNVEHVLPRQRLGRISSSDLIPLDGANEVDILSELPGEPMSFTAYLEQRRIGRLGFEQQSFEDLDHTYANGLGITSLLSGLNDTGLNLPWHDTWNDSRSFDDAPLSRDMALDFWETFQDEMDGGPTRVPTESDLSDFLLPVSRESTYDCLASELNLLHDLEADEGAPEGDSKVEPAAMHEPEPIDVPTQRECTVCDAA